MVPDSGDKIRIAVIDDHPLFREGVVSVLNANPAFAVVSQGASADEALTTARANQLDLIILDISMPGGGIEALKALRRLQPDLKVVMLTVSESEDHIISALELGASGYILKGISGSELAHRLQGIRQGEIYITPGLAARLLTQMRQRSHDNDIEEDSPELTKREEEVLSHVSKGLTNKEIARVLQLSEKTIKHYMTNVLQKLQARNRVEAVLAIQKRAERGPH
jgi:two-component system, NarL family, nitrate/nitrite response regulator NarL